MRAACAHLVAAALLFSVPIHGQGFGACQFPAKANTQTARPYGGISPAGPLIATWKPGSPIRTPARTSPYRGTVNERPYTPLVTHGRSYVPYDTGQNRRYTQYGVQVKPYTSHVNPYTPRDNVATQTASPRHATAYPSQNNYHSGYSSGGRQGVNPRLSDPIPRSDTPQQTGAYTRNHRYATMGRTQRHQGMRPRSNITPSSNTYRSTDTPRSPFLSAMGNYRTSGGLNTLSQMTPHTAYNQGYGGMPGHMPGYNQMPYMDYDMMADVREAQMKARRYGIGYPHNNYMSNTGYPSHAGYPSRHGAYVDPDVIADMQDTMMDNRMASYYPSHTTHTPRPTTRRRIGNSNYRISQRNTNKIMNMLLPNITKTSVPVKSASPVGSPSIRTPAVRAPSIRAGSLRTSFMTRRRSKPTTTSWNFPRKPTQTLNLSSAVSRATRPNNQLRRVRRSSKKIRNVRKRRQIFPPKPRDCRCIDIKDLVWYNEVAPDNYGYVPNMSGKCKPVKNVNVVCACMTYTY